MQRSPNTFQFIDKQTDDIVSAWKNLEDAVAGLRDEYARYKVGWSGLPIRRITNLSSPYERKDGRPRLLGMLNETYRWQDDQDANLPLGGIMILFGSTCLDHVRAAETTLIHALRQLCHQWNLVCMNQISHGGRDTNRDFAFVYLVWA